MDDLDLSQYEEITPEEAGVVPAASPDLGDEYEEISPEEAMGQAPAQEMTPQAEGDIDLGIRDDTLTELGGMAADAGMWALDKMDTFGRMVRNTIDTMTGGEQGFWEGLSNAAFDSENPENYTPEEMVEDMFGADGSRSIFGKGLDKAYDIGADIIFDDKYDKQAGRDYAKAYIEDGVAPTVVSILTDPVTYAAKIAKLASKGTAKIPLLQSDHMAKKVLQGTADLTDDGVKEVASHINVVDGARGSGELAKETVENMAEAKRILLEANEQAFDLLPKEPVDVSSVLDTIDDQIKRRYKAGGSKTTEKTIKNLEGVRDRINRTVEFQNIAKAKEVYERMAIDGNVGPEVSRTFSEVSEWLDDVLEKKATKKPFPKTFKTKMVIDGQEITSTINLDKLAKKGPNKISPKLLKEVSQGFNKDLVGTFEKGVEFSDDYINSVKNVNQSLNDILKADPASPYSMAMSQISDGFSDLERARALGDPDKVLKELNAHGLAEVRRLKGEKSMTRPIMDDPLDVYDRLMSNELIGKVTSASKENMGRALKEDMNKLRDAKSMRSLLTQFAPKKAAALGVGAAIGGAPGAATAVVMRGIYEQYGPQMAIKILKKNLEQGMEGAKAGWKAKALANTAILGHVLEKVVDPGGLYESTGQVIIDDATALDSIISEILKDQSMDPLDRLKAIEEVKKDGKFEFSFGPQGKAKKSAPKSQDNIRQMRQNTGVK